MIAHVRDRLSAYLDGEIPTEERDAMSRHLSECSECRRFLEELAAVDDVARALPARAPEGYFETFVPRLRTRLEARSRPGFRPPVWSLAVAAALLLAVITPLTLKERSVPAPASFDEPARGGLRPDTAQPAAVSPTAPPAVQAVPKPAGVGGDVSQGRVAGTMVSAPPATVARSEAAFAELKDSSEPGRKKEAAPAKSQATEADKRRDVDAETAPFASPPSSDTRVALTLQAEDTAGSGPAPEARPQGLAKSRLAPGAVQGRSRTLTEGLLSAGEARYRTLRTRTAATAEEARELRLEWRTFAESALGSAHADDARVAAIEAAAQAYRFSERADDREIAESDAKAYLARPEAPQAERVRALLATISDAP